MRKIRELEEIYAKRLENYKINQSTMKSEIGILPDLEENAKEL